MYLYTSSVSRLFLGGLLISFLTIFTAGCDKDDPPPPPTIPVVTTAALNNISSSGAIGGGSIVSDGGATVTASGIVWSQTNATPTLADSVIAGTTATGTFTSEITGLEFDKSYYIRAFATNSVGTAYGEVVTLNTTNDTNKVRFTYNGEEVVCGIIVSPTTGKKWLDRNLGAKQVAADVDDYLAYGDLFQWGRPDDGHQLVNWTSSTEGTPVNGTTTNLATSDVPGHSDFIIPPSVDPWVLDWRDNNNRDRWKTIPRGPCPAGWHVPTLGEWVSEIGIAWYDDTPDPIKNLNEAYNKLKLPAAGYRVFYDGVVVIRRVGSFGEYWTSSDEEPIDGDGNGMGFFRGKAIEFGSDYFQYGSGEMSAAMPVRCIQD